jgi:hypothetical protein
MEANSYSRAVADELKTLGHSMAVVISSEVVLALPETHDSRRREVLYPGERERTRVKSEEQITKATKSADAARKALAALGLFIPEDSLRTGPPTETQALLSVSAWHLTGPEYETRPDWWPVTHYNSETSILVNAKDVASQHAVPYPDEWPGLAAVLTWVATNRPDVSLVRFSFDSNPIQGVEVYEW